MSILMAAFAALGAGADVTPNAVDWANVSGASPQANANQTISGIDVSITISLSDSGGFSGFEYRLDSGSYVTYSVPFSVNDGQTLNFRVPGLIPGTNAGTITVVNDSDASTTLDTFTYSVDLPL